MESKQCTQCKRTSLFEEFKMNKRTGQLTKQCIKCLDIQKKSTEKNKCMHGKQKSKCKICGGIGICPHGKQKFVCKICGGNGICEHQKIKIYCKECKGGSICEHNKKRSTCKECEGGALCQHQRIRSICKDCGGGQICQHKKKRSICKICDPTGHLAHVVRNRIYQALKYNKEMRSTEYLGCNIEKFREHIESQFKEGMSWDNYGKWHIDHKIPIAYKQDGISPTIEEIAKRLHYTNTQPLWADENISKVNRYIS